MDSTRTLPVGLDLPLTESVHGLLAPALPLSPDVHATGIAVPVPEDLPGERVVVIVEALDGQAIWAYVSVTHNETQHVTIFAPH
jgi:hypothetical protein